MVSKGNVEHSNLGMRTNAKLVGGSDTYFCSELVAAALQEVNLLPREINSNYFWPGSFACNGEIDKIISEYNPSSSVKYGDEIIIDCRIAEISKAINSSI